MATERNYFDIATTIESIISDMEVTNKTLDLYLQEEESLLNDDFEGTKNKDNIFLAYAIKDRLISHKKELDKLFLEVWPRELPKNEIKDCITM
jgi:hypothetical protein